MKLAAVSLSKNTKFDAKNLASAIQTESWRQSFQWIRRWITLPGKGGYNKLKPSKLFLLGKIW